MAERMGMNHGGNERMESAEAKADRILRQELSRRKWGEEELGRRRKSDVEKIQMAGRLRTETTMSWGWIARRLAMGTAGYAADCLRT
jgi:hypothetical protein